MHGEMWKEESPPSHHLVLVRAPGKNMQDLLSTATAWKLKTHLGSNETLSKYSCAEYSFPIKEKHHFCSPAEQSPRIKYSNLVKACVQNPAWAAYTENQKYKKSKLRIFKNYKGLSRIIHNFWSYEGFCLLSLGWLSSQSQRILSSTLCILSFAQKYEYLDFSQLFAQF